ncbi:MAG: DUF2062 domain-containing protein [Hydrogenophaga sp.]|uniref:DUF2062 domain-containing protein n=1 Tax=Hydrogenophaga sp. TaxID=1904254 RepID=UPI002616409C|nr:DUF2062 domain-containing protein [Hydrogenophaga sp.]MDM7942561.1 DUF2062 domain-containing protein [Hydrogenophaga sp.]
MKNRLKTWLPKPETLQSNRWLRWMGPVLNHPRLWHFSRKGIALGLALGIFFGLLIPVAQIPFAAALAVVLRANVPMAVASTLVTNPVTFGPVYYGAYRLGKAVLGQEAPTDREIESQLQTVQESPPVAQGWGERLSHGLQQLGTVGKPLVVGLAIVASLSGIAVYFLASGIWVLRTRWMRSKRLRARMPGAGNGS